ARAGMLVGLDYATLVKVSDEELAFLTDGDLKPLWRDNIQIIVVTRGPKGATAYLRDGSEVSDDGYAVQAMDTTGAGDGFVAGLLVGILEHPEDYMPQLSKILCFANAVGAITTTQRGAIPALPTREQVDQFAKC
ncbi:MAG: hypothetical protein H7Y09_00210, partial [Chitinophagaceae bacterium]|nr:hypothetical protein [Anaerolineae bacterium]